MLGSLIEKLMPNHSPIDSSPDTDPEVFLSIERSRKRHLSPGVIRGDRVADCLKVQEASASPFLKKSKQAEQYSTPATPPEHGTEMALSGQDFRDYMDSKVTNRLDSLDNSISNIVGSISKLTFEVKDNSGKIEKQAGLINNNADAIARLKDDIKNIKEDRIRPAANPVSLPPTGGHPGDAEDPLYWMARRSVRIWPIQGLSKTEIWGSTGNFLRITLGLAHISENKIEEISRPEFPSGPTAINEVLVRFKETETRDSVMGASSKLASKIDCNGKPTAGIRIEVTANLRPAMKTLERYGQQLRSRHGPGTKRHFKFDDIDRSLYLNVKLPGDARWSRKQRLMSRWKYQFSCDH